MDLFYLVHVLESPGSQTSNGSSSSLPALQTETSIPKRRGLGAHESFSLDFKMPQSFSRWLPKPLQNLPLPALRIIVLLVFVNLVVWAVVGIVLATTHKTELAGTAVLSYTLGLRHALDADHISVCDCFFFSLIFALGNETMRTGSNDGVEGLL